MQTVRPKATIKNVPTFYFNAVWHYKTDRLRRLYMEIYKKKTVFFL